MLFDAHFDSVFAYCLVRCGSRGLAEEVAGQVFVDAARTVRPDSTAELSKGWLLATARHRLVDGWRRRGREQARLDRLRLVRAPAEPDELVGDRVLAALESMPDRQRQVLTLRYLDELSVSEVADQLELTYRATESLLARARKSFERAYDEGSVA